MPTSQQMREVFSTLADLADALADLRENLTERIDFVAHAISSAPSDPAWEIPMLDKFCPTPMALDHVCRFSRSANRWIEIHKRADLAEGFQRRVDALFSQAVEAELAREQVPKHSRLMGLEGMVIEFTRYLWDLGDALKGDLMNALKYEAESSQGASRATRSKDEPVDPLSGEAKAVGLLIAHSDWTDQQVADAVPCHRGSLHRWPLYKNAKASLRQGRDDMPRGQVTYRETRKGKVKDFEAYDGHGGLTSGGSWDDSSNK